MASSSSFQRGERRGRWGSPERTVVWTEPKPKPKPARKLAVVYYLCHRDGHLDHPHFLEMELPRSTHPAPGLYLRDFTARLNALRGDGMAGMYSWSSKRSYRNGYVWQDLTEDDLIHPAHGNDEYVLKGSSLLLFPQPPPAHQDASSFTFSQEKRAGSHRKNRSSFDLGDCNNKLLVAQQSAATQTDHRGPEPDRDADPSMELAVDEISPPPSSSSPDALESCSREVGVIAGGRMRASAVLMQIFSCGSMTAVKRGHARSRSDLVTASASTRRADKEVDAYASATAECESVSGGAGVVERDYFSGSLIESSKKRGGDDALLLKRSSSCNADSRGAAKLKLPVPAKEVRAGCLASRGSRATKKNMTKSTAAQSTDGGECKGATVDGPGAR
ncbi:protein SOSEKI 5-like isoform X1 [Miscanthus floridulus]|uniref:protein SOSEKI 5-like isoform X1 n=1 Tax=Miscanthus floridulus TaxID=154761 RepID=UPI00345AAC28